MDCLASIEDSSLKRCLRISDENSIEGLFLMMFYVVRSDLARDIVVLFDLTYKIGYCDWI